MAELKETALLTNNIGSISEDSRDCSKTCRNLSKYFPPDPAAKNPIAGLINICSKFGAFIEIDPIYFPPMLHHLSIQNYATVDSLEIELKTGMTVLTGETGAGKSIILGALGLTLGDRADKTVVRTGAIKTDICAEFDTSKINAAQAWLEENDLDADGDSSQCILRRVVNNEGRSKGYINGSPVTMASLKALGEMLLDIHSQHEHQSLLQRSTHQRLLDEFGVKAKTLSNLQTTWKQWQKNHQQIQNLSNQSDEYSAQSQLLSYQLSELDELAIAENEFSELETEHKLLNSADETIASVQSALAICGDDEEKNINGMLQQALAILQELPEKTKRIDNIIKLLETANIQLDEAVSDLRSYTDDFHANPQRLDEVNSRLSILHNVARKHKVSPVELSALIASIREQLGRFQNSDEELAILTANDLLLRTQYQQLASDVSKQRKTASKKLAKQVNAQLQNLGMPNAELEVCLQSLDSESPSLIGMESAEFLVSTNPGQDAKPMIKVASGGELSRISLAIQVITAQTSQIPSLVFDEVDVGIGGGVAKTVGQLMRDLGKTTQILCVTHQAQVAGQGHNHFLVSKLNHSGCALSQIRELADDEKVKEVARMLGGENLSDESLAHAEQMVATS